MKLPRLRFTVRRLIIVVAVFAVVVWIIRLRGLSREYALLATAAHWDRFAASEYSPRDEAGAVRKVRRIQHYRRLAEKYDFAARYPWLPVAPDPPEPE
jgi:hypothetical protein